MNAYRTRHGCDVCKNPRIKDGHLCVRCYQDYTLSTVGLAYAEWMAFARDERRMERAANILRYGDHGGHGC